MARLVLMEAQGERSVDLSEQTSIGRDPQNHVHLTDRVVSKDHCTIYRNEGAWLVVDLGSRNGTYVNGQRIRGRHPLHHGDELVLGTTRARFESPPLGPVGSRPDRAPAPRAATSPPRSIETQLTAAWQGFLPAEALAQNPARLAADYERLRHAHALARQLGLERDLPRLLTTVLDSLFSAVCADRGAILLYDESAQLQPAASLTRSGKAATLRLSQSMIDHVIRERAAVLTADAPQDFGDAQHRSVIVNRINSAIVTPLVFEHEVLGVLWLDSATLSKFDQRDLEVVTTIAAQAAMFIQLTALNRRIASEAAQRERFRRLLSPNLAEQVLSGKMRVERGGQRVQHCTVFNSDIRGFTELSRQARPEDVVSLLNEYFECMVQAIFACEGTLDKFMGDGIMALWGAPLTHPDDADRAVRCALVQMAALRQMNDRRQSLGQALLEIGIGIHTGPVVAGYVGSPEALSYTVIGDTANISARLCSQAKGGEVVISQATHDRLQAPLDTFPLPDLVLPGSAAPLRRYAVRY